MIDFYLRRLLEDNVQSWHEWCGLQHDFTRQAYNDKLPYSFHLDLVKKEIDYYLGNHYAALVKTKFADFLGRYFHVILDHSGSGHDLIEDPHNITYNDLKKKYVIVNQRIDKLKITNDSYGRDLSDYEDRGLKVANICFAVSGDTGRNRDERNSEALYKRIRETLGAEFIKLCDRKANVRFGIFTGSTMASGYKKEHKHFKESIYGGELEFIWKDLEKLYDSKF